MDAIEIQGHRGYGDLAPHNTLAAFKKAAADPNTSSVEFDVRGTSDGHLVVTHGAEVGLQSEDATLADLQAKDLGGGERVPLLSDVVDTCLKGKLFMNVEIKPGNGADKTLKTIALLRRKGALPSCSISSFDRKILRLVMEACPKVQVGALYHPAMALKDPSDVSKGVIYSDAPEDFASWCSRKVKGDSVNLRAEAILRDESLVKRARAAGKKVLAWMPCRTNPGFEEGEDLYRRVIDLGVDIICVNRPDILADVLKSKKGGKDAEAEAEKKTPKKSAPAKVAEAKKSPAKKTAAPAEARGKSGAPGAAAEKAGAPKAKAAASKSVAKAKGKAKAKAKAGAVEAVQKKPAAKRARTP